MRGRRGIEGSSEGPAMITRQDIARAAARIEPHVRETPVLAGGAGAFGLDHPVVLKLEYLQHAGSFKPRGAFNNLLSRAVPAAGVAAASGGNHGIAVAHAARALGHRARIFVPSISSPAKIAAIKARGGECVVGGADYMDALAACDAYVAESGALSVHAYDSEETIAGQGSLGKEWERQSPGLDTVLVAVGGGGLIAGIALWYQRRVKVVGVEPEGARSLQAALEAGGPLDMPIDSVAADSLGARRVGRLAFEAARQAVEEVVVVPDRAILEAQRLLWRDIRAAIEPGGATALAALVAGAYRPSPGERVGVLLCGANVELDKINAGPDPGL
jgi:threonine dehydratase